MAVGQIISRAIADGAITTSDINDGDITHAKLHTDMDLSAKTLTVPSTVRGPATLTIDPAAVGDNTGLVVIAGDLQVDGTTTTINSTTMTVDDKNLVLASGAGNSGAADGAGITIDGASATMLYTHATTSFDFNKQVNITGDLTLTSTDTGATDNPSLILYRNSSSPADSDDLGEILFRGRNDNSQDVEYAKIWTEALDVSDGTEDGKFYIDVMVNGTLTNFMNITGSYIYYNRDIHLWVNRNLVFEGATADGHETTLTVTDPTQDNTITFPDATGQVVLSSGAINTDASAEIGKGHFGYTGWSNIAGFSHIDNNSQTNYSLLQSSNGTTYINAPTGQAIQLRNNNLNVGQITSTGLYLATSKVIAFEGASNNQYETTLTVTNPTADRTITLPDATGTVALTASPSFTGNVGIGTASPDDVLEIQGSTNNTSRQVKIVDSSNATATHIGQLNNISYFTNNTYYNGSAWVRDDAAVGSSFLGLDNGAVLFGANTTATPNERMRVSSDGKVGIGADGNMTAKFTVNKPAAGHTTGYQEDIAQLVTTESTYLGRHYLNFFHDNKNRDASGDHTVWGMAFGYDNNTRGGIQYDHKGQERMTLWSSYGTMQFKLPATAVATKRADQITENPALELKNNGNNLRPRQSGICLTLSGTQVWNSGNNWVKVNLNTIVYQNGNTSAWDSSNTRYTCPESGLYLVTTSVQMEQNTGATWRYLFPCINGATNASNGMNFADFVPQSQPNATYYHHTHSCILNCSSGDYIEWKITGSGGSSSIKGGVETACAIYFLG